MKDARITPKHPLPGPAFFRIEGNLMTRCAAIHYFSLAGFSRDEVNIYLWNLPDEMVYESEFTHPNLYPSKTLADKLTRYTPKHNKAEDRVEVIALRWDYRKGLYTNPREFPFGGFTHDGCYGSIELAYQFGLSTLMETKDAPERPQMPKERVLA